MGAVRLIVTFEVNDYDRFKAVVEECSEYVSRNESGTLAYEWHLNEEKTVGQLFEVYEGIRAFEEHLLGSVFKDIGPKFGSSISWISINSFGELPEVFHKIMGELPIKNWAKPEFKA